jgi:CheY-like chemotaxis protein
MKCEEKPCMKSKEAKTILIIEDEEDIRIFATRVLELEGYKVFGVGDGEDGLKMVKECPVDLVLLDLRLPRRDGWSVMEQMKSEPQLSKIPVLAFTASAGAAAREKVIGMGAVGFLVKPLRADTLMEAVTGILSEP